MAFGIDPKRVFENDGGANIAFWTVFTGHVHGEVVKALKADTAVQVAIQAKFNDPNNAKKRGNVVDHINRATVNCLGQHIAGQALKPEQAGFTLYNLLPTGVAAEVDRVIGEAQNAELHKAFADKKSDEIIAVISRQTGRAMFQACVSEFEAEALNPEALIGKVKDELLKAAQGIIHGIH